MYRIRSLITEHFRDETRNFGLKCIHLQVQGFAQASSATVLKRRKKPSLTFRLRKSFQQDESKPEDLRPLFAGVLLERYPICFQEPAPYKLQHEEWSSAWNSWKFRQVPDELINADKQNVDETSEEAKFKPEPVITEADHVNDIRSLRRNTQGYLYFACKEDDSASWRIPETRIQGTESVRDAAQRCIQEIVGNSIEIFLFGNLPAAHVETEHARIFYMLGVVLDGNVELQGNSPTLDFAWLRKSELAESFPTDKKMKKLIETLAVEPQHA